MIGPGGYLQARRLIFHKMPYIYPLNNPGKWQPPFSVLAIYRHTLSMEGSVNSQKSIAHQTDLGPSTYPHYGIFLVLHRHKMVSKAILSIIASGRCPGHYIRHHCCAGELLFCGASEARYGVLHAWVNTLW